MEKPSCLHISNSSGSDIDIFGPREVAKIGGVMIPKFTPSIPFTREDMRIACKLGQYLIFQVSKASDGFPLTMNKIRDSLGNKLEGDTFLKNSRFCEPEYFFSGSTPYAGWKLVSREVIPGSVGKDYVEQTQAIADYLRNEVYDGQELPGEYQKAVDEFEACRENLRELLNDGHWRDVTGKCLNLKLNRLFRPTPVEVIYNLMVCLIVNQERLLEDTYASTRERFSDGGIVVVGEWDTKGIGVYDVCATRSVDEIGVYFCRGAIPES